MTPGDETIYQDRVRVTLYRTRPYRIAGDDSQRRRFLLQRLRIKAVVHRADGKFTGVIPLIIDTGANLSLFSNREWRGAFEESIEWVDADRLFPIQPTTASQLEVGTRIAVVGGRRLDCRLGFVTMHFSDGQRTTPPIHILARFAQTDLEHSLLGLGGDAFLNHDFHLAYGPGEAWLVYRGMTIQRGK
jgi:hypothetical protein